MSAILRINDEKPRVCAKCKHYNDKSFGFDLCTKSIDVVSGGHRLCAAMRGIQPKDKSDGQPAHCGLSGDLWEAR